MFGLGYVGPAHRGDQVSKSSYEIMEISVSEYGPVRRETRCLDRAGNVFETAQLRWVGENDTFGEVRDKTQVYIKAIRERIADLQWLGKALSKTVANCEGDNAPNFPVVDALVNEA